MVAITLLAWGGKYCGHLIFNGLTHGAYGALSHFTAAANAGVELGQGQGNTAQNAARFFGAGADLLAGIGAEADLLAGPSGMPAGLKPDLHHAEHYLKLMARQLA